MFNGGYYYYPKGPFSLPTHGATTRETTSRGDGLTSQYRLMLTDPWPFRNGIEFGIEHGAGDGLPTSVRSVVFWYDNEHPGMRQTSSIDVGNRVSEAAAAYRASAPDPEYKLTAFYEGARDGNLSSLNYDLPSPNHGFVIIGSQPPPPGTDPLHESITDSGRRHRPGAVIKFRLRIDPDNEGVVLRRRLDQATYGQRAAVYANGIALGIWLTPGSNTRKRWADSDFWLPSTVTAGRRQVAVELRVLKPDDTLPGTGKGWTDFLYTAFSIT